METHENITNKRFEQIKKLPGTIIIDVRTPGETKRGKITPEAKEIDFYNEEFKEQINKLDKNARYIVYCRTGARSNATMHLMKQLGFKQVFNLEQGIQGYNANKESE